MFCPSCKAEYRQGFTRCSDCGVDLVFELPKKAAAVGGDKTFILDDAEEAGPLKVIWTCTDAQTCARLCEQLRSAGIYYRVAQSIESRSTGTRVSWRYEIAVPAAEYDRARELLEIEAESSTEHESGDESDDQEETENDVLKEPVDEAFAAEEQARSDSYLKEWDPQDATAKVWPQDSEEDYAPAIAAFLKENCIRFRSQVNKEGITELFVLSEDEPQAQKIVREILSNSHSE